MSYRAGNNNNGLTRKQIFANADQIWNGMLFEQWDAIHNKLRLIQAQGLECAPVCAELVPRQFPVILKPIISLAGTRQKYRVCMNSQDYQKLVTESGYVGWFWMPYLDSEDSQQRCIELLIHNGRPVFGYSLDYHSNPDVPGALTHISLNTSYRPMVSNIPGWSNILAPALKDYTGPMSLYYIGSYIISASARWTIWSEYVWQSPDASVSPENNLSAILDQIIRVLGVYTSNPDQDASGACHDLLRQGLGPRVISLVPLYLKSSADQVLARRHWTIISRKLDCALNWISKSGGADEYMPFAGVVVVNSVEQLKKVNKYKQISQLAAPEQHIPVVY